MLTVRPIDYEFNKMNDYDSRGSTLVVASLFAFTPATIKNS
jgi:hypothetical protein